MNREMQSNEDLQSFLPPLSSVHNSKNKSNLRKIHVWIKAALRRTIENHLHPPKRAPPEPKNWKARKRPLNGCSLTLVVLWYLQNVYGALSGVEIEQDGNFWEMWETMGAENPEIESAILRMLHVTPEYIVLVSNQAEIVVD